MDSRGRVLPLIVALDAPIGVRADEPRLLLGTTVGLERSGLLDVLLPDFERQTGRRVTTVAVSAPQALGLGARGELDVLLVDAADDEPGYVAAGHAIDRRLVMHADEVILGPRDDPARVKEAADLDGCPAPNRGLEQRLGQPGRQLRPVSNWRSGCGARPASIRSDRPGTSRSARAWRRR